MINDLEKYLYERLLEMQEEKAKGTTVPNQVTKKELFSGFDKDVKSILNEWWRAGKIKVHKTVHPSQNDYVELIIKKDNEN